MVDSHIELVRAPNPSAMTLSGTNSYLIDCGDGRALCIDPGPAIERHVRALIDRAEERNCAIAAIALTHGHPDHAPAARILADRTGAAIAAHPKSAVPHTVNLSDGDAIEIGDARIEVMESPGHTFDHLVFYDPREKALFTGDVVLGEGYVVIAPPGGAMRPYQRTLERLLEQFGDADTIFGGHGDPVRDPAAKLRDYMEHRRSRQREILAELESGPHTITQLVRTIYRETSPILWPAAARQLLAYLIALEEERVVRSRTAGRELTNDEDELLNPAWERIVGPEHASTVQAELGAMLRLDDARVYELIR